MDASVFDRLSRALASAGSRRGVLALFAALPLAGATLTWRDEEAGARRKKKKRKKKGEVCQPASDAETCAGQCGRVTNTCGTAVDCGSCACPACPACQRCDPNTRQCQPNPAHVGLPCGDGQVCQDTGICACNGESCGICRRCDTAKGRCEPNPAVPNRTVCAGSGAATHICCNGVCCDGCCGADGSCGACRAFVTGCCRQNCGGQGCNFGGSNGDIGGLAGADALCQGAAGEGGLPGAYKAWLSDSTASPKTRFRCSAAACSREGYVRVDGAIIATDWGDLTDGTLAVPISVTQFGDELRAGDLRNTWSHTRTDGSAVASNNTCRDWTCSFDCDEELGDQGHAAESDAAWTEDGDIQCSPPRLLYCFQQD